MTLSSPKTIPPPTTEGLQTIQKDFDRYQKEAFDSREAKFFALELCGECGELANLEKKLWRDPTTPLLPETFADEAADVMIALLNYCNAKGIDLQGSLTKKLQVIEQRRLLGKMGKI